MIDLNQLEKNHKEKLQKFHKIKSKKNLLFKIIYYIKEILSLKNDLISEVYIAESIHLLIPILKDFSPFGVPPGHTAEIILIIEKIKPYASTDSQSLILEASITRIQNELKYVENLLGGQNIVQKYEEKIFFPLIEHGLEDENFSGSIDSISVTLNSRKKLIENVFLVVPSLPNLDTKFEIQLQNSWDIATNFLAKKIRKKIPNFEIVIKFNEKLGIYEGDSNGIALTIIFIVSLAKYFNLRTNYLISDTALFTGIVNKKGKVDSLSNHIIGQKTKTAFYSKVETLVLPSHDVNYARDILEMEKQKYPKRKLDLVPIESINEIFQNKDVVQENKKTTIEYYSNKLNNNKYLTLSLFLVVLLVILSPMLYYQTTKNYIKKIEFLPNAIKNYNLDESKLAPIVNDDALFSLKMDKYDLELHDSSKIGYLNNIELVENRFGEEGEAFNFNGIDSYMQLKDSEKFKVDFPITVSTWFKKKNMDQGWLFSSCYDSLAYQGMFLGITTGNIVSLHYGNGGVIGSLNSRRSVYLLKPIELNEWIHIVGIISDDMNMDIYLNNKKQKCYYSGYAKKISYNNLPACFGIINNSTVVSAKYFDGAIDDFRFYNKVLSEEEIDELFHEKY